MLNLAVLVAALGYFVDIYDLILFSVVRVPSIRELGVPESEFLGLGMLPFHSQMIGMLIGGIFWGVLGDKKGRLKVLFGSIILYSFANLANAAVHDIYTYAALRFIAGLGLAGELGAGITLVSEILPKNKRGYGTTIVASVGVLGALFASTVSELVGWRGAYVVGGVAGLLLLLLRIGVVESGMFNSIHTKGHVKRGSLKMLFGNLQRTLRYVRCVLIGCPVWFALGIFMQLAPEFGVQAGLLNAQGKSLVLGSKAVFYAYLGLTLGDLFSGILSQVLKSRKKSLFLFLTIMTVSCALFLYRLHSFSSPESLYTLLIPIGFGAGYWAVFITTASEQFGTNLRATVTTSVPNFVRGSAVPMIWAFKTLIPALGGSYINATIAVGVVVMSLAFASVALMKESFHTDLDFVEG